MLLVSLPPFLTFGGKLLPLTGKVGGAAAVSSVLEFKAEDLRALKAIAKQESAVAIVAKDLGKRGGVFGDLVAPAVVF